MTQLSLTLDAPVSRPHTLDITGDAKGFMFAKGDDIDPMKRAHIAIGKYVGRYGRQPAWMTCAASEAAVIGGEVLGVPVFPVNTSASLYRLGMTQES